ncbi:MAG: polyprenyl synthetase family protein [Rickettsiales bacterium]|jgi:octaprenyl-diphosphate synthase|nr:polyprenyl synthetase family protein [Rickettsiales bacterium]
MSNQKAALKNIRNLAQDDLKSMDLVIEKLLQEKEQLIHNITYHIINSGGKRLRPILTILCAKLFYYKGEKHINLAAAVEFIHTATLLHDDVVDHSNLRRGSPTANNNWDNKSSILVGDFLFSQAFILLSENNDLNIIQVLSKAASVISEGEVKQLSSISNLTLNKSDYLKIISAKTAELFAASCQVGAAVAGQDKALQLEMYKFGLNLGMAFQIMDDLLDYIAEGVILGKDIGDDFQEGKVTIPIIIAYELSDDDEKKFWQRVISSSEKNQKDFSWALDVFNKYHVIDKCLNMAEDFINTAKQHLVKAPDNQIKEALIEVLDFSVNRNF